MKKIQIGLARPPTFLHQSTREAAEGPQSRIRNIPSFAQRLRHCCGNFRLHVSQKTVRGHAVLASIFVTDRKENDFLLDGRQARSLSKQLVPCPVCFEKPWGVCHVRIHVGDHPQLLPCRLERCARKRFCLFHCHFLKLKPGLVHQTVLHSESKVIARRRCCPAKPEQTRSTRSVHSSPLERFGTRAIRSISTLGCADRKRFASVPSSKPNAACAARTVIGKPGENCRPK